MDAKTLCLGALVQGDASGYEIRKLYEEGPFSAFHAVSFGSIYPALNQLLKEGLVTVEERPQEGRPDKKVYSITAEGRRRFVNALLVEPQPDKFRSDMLYIFFFGHMLPPERLAELLDGYVAEHEAKLLRMEQCEGHDLTPGQRFVHGFGQAIYETIARYVAENRHLIEHPEGAATQAERKHQEAQ